MATITELADLAEGLIEGASDRYDMQDLEEYNEDNDWQLTDEELRRLYELIHRSGPVVTDSTNYRELDRLLDDFEQYAETFWSSYNGGYERGEAGVDAAERAELFVAKVREIVGLPR